MSDSDAKEKERRRERGMKAIMEVSAQVTENLTRMFLAEFEQRRRSQQQQIPINNAPIQINNAPPAQPQAQSSSTELDHNYARSPSAKALQEHDYGGEEDEIILIQSADNTRIPINVNQNSNATENNNIPAIPCPPNVPESQQTVKQIGHGRHKTQLPEVVDKMILEYAKWTMEGNRKRGSFQLLMSSIERVIGQDAKMYCGVIKMRISKLRKKIMAEHSQQLQQQQNATIPINNNDLPSTSSSTRSTATTTPADDLLMEQEHLLQNRTMTLEQQHEIETNANGQNTRRHEMMVGHFDENENPIMNLMARFGEKYDQNHAVRNIDVNDAHRNGDQQEEVGYEEIDGLAKAERNENFGGFGHEFGDDPEASSMSSQTDGFLDDRNTSTGTDAEERQSQPPPPPKLEMENSMEVQNNNNNNVAENAESTAPPSNLTENVPTPIRAETVPNPTLKGVNDMEIDNAAEPLQNDPDQIGENNDMEIDDSAVEHVPLQYEPTQFVVGKNVENNPFAEPLQNEPNLTMENVQNNAFAVPLQGKKGNNPKGKRPNLARRSKPFDKFNAQNPGLTRKFCKVPNQSKPFKKEAIAEMTNNLIVRKTSLLTITMNEGRPADAEKKRCVKPEPRSEFDDMAKSAASTSAAAEPPEGNVIEMDGQMTAGTTSGEHLPPLFRPPPLLRFESNSIIQVFVEDLGKVLANKMRAKNSATKSSVKKRQRHRTPSPSSIPSTSTAAPILPRSPLRSTPRRGNVNAEAGFINLDACHEQLPHSLKNQLIYNGSIRCNECDPIAELSRSAYPLHMLKEHGIFVGEDGPVMNFLSTLEKEEFQQIVWKCEFCKLEMDTLDHYMEHCETEEHKLRAPKQRKKKHTLEDVKKIQEAFNNGEGDGNN